MNRRDIIKSIALGSGVLTLGLIPGYSNPLSNSYGGGSKLIGKEFNADVIVIGGGLGGCAASLAALRNGLKVIMTEETDWIGGQMTQQAVSVLDEHQWIEKFGCTESYRQIRNGIRSFYKMNYPLSEAAKSEKYLNPGNGAVSRLCFEPRVGLAVLYEKLAPYLSSQRLVLLLKHKAIEADMANDKVNSIKVKDLETEDERVLSAPYFLDATELGDLLPLTGTEFVTGSESRKDTHELHAEELANPANQQAYTMCFVMDYTEGANYIMDKPKDYNFWKNYVPHLMPPWSGRLLDLKYSNPRTLKASNLGFNPSGTPTGKALNLWNYRKIIDPANFKPDFYKGGITIVNWPQNDFLLGNLVGVSKDEYQKMIYHSEQLSLSLFYWLQTEAPRNDGKTGWAGLRLRGDILGTQNGLAKFPYIRESRRIKAAFTILEEHIGTENRLLVAGKKEGGHAAIFYDSVGVGYYHIDLHPTSGGNNYVDFNSLPFQIPLGALLPVRMQNLIPACKNVGTTHITNGCYREHPEEWNIGESAGLLVSYALLNKTLPHAIRENKHTLAEFQHWLQMQGVEISWPSSVVKL